MRGSAMPCDSNLAVLHHGRLLFHGSPADLIAAAQGKVWQVTSGDGNKPGNGLIVVSTQHMAEGIQYRVVGRDAGLYSNAQAVQPSLEDGYVWLMRGANSVAAAGSAW